MNNTVGARIDKDRLSPPARLGEVIMIICMLLLFAFFVYHQSAETGFFTEKFGVLEMICLYVPLLLGMSAPAVRAWTGHRNPARPFEAVTSLLLALGALWLLIVFPFDYSHLADTLPNSVQFILAWVTDGIAKVVFLLQIVFGPISALVTMWRYFANRQREVAPSWRTL